MPAPRPTPRQADERTLKNMPVKTLVHKDLTIEGGSIFGIPAVTSATAGALILLLNTREILVADDGDVAIDTSRHATLEMNSAPGDPPVETGVFTSLWQHNLVGLRAERTINWKRATANCLTGSGTSPPTTYPARCSPTTLDCCPTGSPPRWPTGSGSSRRWGRCAATRSPP